MEKYYRINEWGKQQQQLIKENYIIETRFDESNLF